MAHYAQIDGDNIVQQVLVVEQDVVDTGKLGDPSKWIQTSYNTHGGKYYDPKTQEEDSGTPLRKNFAGKGYTYDSDRDAFISPKPFPSWILNEDRCQWEAPIPMPTDSPYYSWDEDNVTWKVSVG
jgi:hypothetical protein